MWVGVEGSGIEDGDSVPARLHLNGEMSLESVPRFDVVEDGLERSVLEGSTVDITGDPAVEGVSQMGRGRIALVETYLS